MSLKGISSFLPFDFNIKLFFWLTIAFIFATIIGTITHELGHCAVAYYLGYDFFLSYGSMGIGALKPGYEEIEYGNNWVEAGGPIETLLTGTIGLILIFIYRRPFIDSISLSMKQWLYIFLALFWLRPSFNLVFWIIGYLMNGRFSRSGDELWIAEALGWPNGTILIITGLIGIVVLLIIIFKFIPPTQRLSFIVAGLIGGLMGFAIWFGGVGELLIP